MSREKNILLEIFINYKSHFLKFAENTYIFLTVPRISSMYERAGKEITYAYIS